MLNLDWKDVFDTMHPGFFDQPHIRAIEPGRVSSEMVLDLKAYAPLPPVPVDEGVRFETVRGVTPAFLDAVTRVVEPWVPLYQSYKGLILLGTEGGRILSFCMLEDMKGYHGLRIGGPGCVGTVPEARGRRIGLRMVQLATDWFIREGYDIGYIHYTGVPHWYARLGYETVLTWTRDGFC